ncbi:MAG: OmpP1/FadL family transporter [Pseudomonadota bacterium]
MMFEKSVLTGSIAAALLLMAGGAAASGFALIEQNASGMGNAYAGAAAIAEDASTVFFNPAGMSRLNGKQVVVAVHAIQPSATFTGTGIPGTNMGGDAGGLAFVPNAYFTAELDSNMHFGLGINAPFGLQTEYDANWVGRHHAIKSKIETVNINPSFSYKVSDALSLGVGLDYQKVKGELSNLAGLPGIATIKGDDSSWGYNLGALYNAGPDTRLGVAYRSAISYTLTGDVTFSGAPILNGPVTLDVKMPDSFSLSGFHKLNEKWDVMADATYTKWSVFQQLKIDRITGVNLTTVQENWSDTWRVAVGANHHYNEKWTARAGLAYDQTPVSDAFRTARIPDNNRTWLSLGGQYRLDENRAIDFGYSHLFIGGSTINQPAPAPTLAGSYSSSVDILSVQYTHSF